METGIEAIRAARAELEEVVAEIRAQRGHEDFLAAPTFDDVASVASEERPVVYLAAADAGGLALVVRGDDVAHVPLPEAGAEELRDRVGEYLGAYDGFRTDPRRGAGRWRRVLDGTTAWLWSAVVGPVFAELRAAGEYPGAVAFVSGGLLGLLPLHAAWTPDESAPTGRHYALDDLAVTYVPNARALAAASQLADHTLDTLLTVTDPALRFGATETAVAAASFGSGVVPLGGPGVSRDDVLAGLQRADVAHFACHGFADLEAPLQSGLVLPGGDVVRLGDILELRTHLRLAVLSACETSLPGTELPDEVVSLPTGLLQAGVGGVVASMWAVPDAETALLVSEFYRRWRYEDVPPAHALRGAQLWLRDSDDEQKIERLETAADDPDGWLPSAAADAFLDDLVVREREDSRPEVWAGLAYLGV